MKKILYILSIVSFAILSCKKDFNPQRDNHRSEEDVINNPLYAKGLLLDPYQSLTTGGIFHNEVVATDDATTNNLSMNFLRMAKGEWSPRFNPMSNYNDLFNQISKLNYFLSIVDKVEWSTDSDLRRKYFATRLKGEAYGLRALYFFDLLQNYGGPVGGVLSGFPIVKKTLDASNVDYLPRNTFMDCYKQIIMDCDSAIQRLPEDYASNFPGTDYFNDADYITVNGPQYVNRLTAGIVKGLKARFALFAASPAYNGGNANTVLMDSAARYATRALSKINGISGLATGGIKFYDDDADNVNPEILWRKNKSSSADIETQNFAPSLFGSGQINPSQNLVDAFPASNGFPIDKNSVGYQNNPYSGRDPRLDAYIVRNNSIFKSVTINTSVDDPANANGLGVSEFSTRTGYYIRKMLREDVNIDPSLTKTPKNHFGIYMRYTELFLIYAEAANEAFGPDVASSGVSYTARQVIAAIRKRAMGQSLNDIYLSNQTSASAMRTLIQNERRLELCFEGFRFWDLRRWGKDITQSITGMRISGTTYTEFTVEPRSYLPFMTYGPIPQSELTSGYSVLKQNDGWQ